MSKTNFYLRKGQSRFFAIDYNDQSQELDMGGGVLSFSGSNGFGRVVVAVVEPHPGEKIDADNGWFESGDVTDEVRELVIAECVKGYGEIFHFAFSSPTGNVMPLRKRADLRSAFNKFIAVSWLMFPELLVNAAGSRLSLRGVSKLSGVSVEYLSTKAEEFGGRWAFHSSVQKKESSRAVCKTAREDYLAKKLVNARPKKVAAKSRR